jgi:hypothetical protein
MAATLSESRVKNVDVPGWESGNRVATESRWRAWTMAGAAKLWSAATGSAAAPATAPDDLRNDRRSMFRSPL